MLGVWGEREVEKAGKRVSDDVLIRLKTATQSTRACVKTSTSYCPRSGKRQFIHEK